MSRILCGLAAVCLSIASTCHAQHKLSASGYVALFDYEFDNRELAERYSNHEGAVHYTLRYQYDLSERWSAGIGYLNGTSNTAENIFDGLLNDKVEVEYQAVQLFAQGRMPVSQRNFLFAEASLSRYDNDLVVDGDTFSSTDGVGFGVGVGWDHEFDNGFGSRVSLSYDRFGDEVQLWSLGVGMSYRF
ncbi:hypothetical protein GCM10011369_34410 [Neiella marina]|uniref:Outer membrane protein beta-barrel domain-containing protein n=1 Tax=Neiella marina TaxID=508461 RepID=A0A8J2UA08_9GAMM|nr:outer membrane beta-barrel protein [Neiella marina]GGA89355.1 hypothetical protein GCM10011369_34410 [Neiella marina]